MFGACLEGYMYKSRCSEYVVLVVRKKLLNCCPSKTMLKCYDIIFFKKVMHKVVLKIATKKAIGII